MATYVEAGRLEQVPPGKGMSFTVAGREVAIFNVDGTIYAMDDSCLHHGVSLGNSDLKGKIITCRGHGWKYDVTTGSTLNVPGYGVTSYPVKVEDGNILVAV
jgi:nitrite reductase/ring-hydroxylating ferredoxin subunit